MNLKKKIAFFFIILIFLIIISLSCGIWGLGQIHTGRNNVATILKIHNKFQKLVIFYEENLKDHHERLISGSDQFNSVIEDIQKIDEKKNELKGLIKQAKAQTDSRFKNVLQEILGRLLILEEGLAEYKILTGKVINAESSMTDPESKLYLKDLSLVIKKIEKFLKNDKGLISEFSIAILEHDDVLYSRSMVIFKLILFTVAITIGIILSYFKIKSILTPLHKMPESKVRSEKGLQEELSDDKEIIEEKALRKSEFFANMSHEIRTPMNGILSMAELMSDTKLTREQTEYLNIIKTSAGFLSSIINEMLDFSKLEAGGLDLEEMEMDLQASLDQTLETLRFKACEKGLCLKFNIDSGVPVDLIGDSIKLHQILTNLIGNALKFTEKGEIIISCKLLEKEQESVLLHFAVSDTGMGIPEDKLDNIFESFYQLESCHKGGYGGVGHDTCHSH